MTPFPPLMDILRQIPDPRHARGKRHPLHAILAMMCVAALCGYKTYSAMAEWGRHYGERFGSLLGFTRPTTPAKSTLCDLLRKVDIAFVEAVISHWVEALLRAIPPSQAEEEAFALDGKTLRGSKKQGADAYQLLAVLGQRLGVTLCQQAIPGGHGERTNEIPVAEALLRHLLEEGRLQGRVWTMDALHTRRENAALIVAGKGDYLMPVKANQPTLLADIRLVFESPLLAETKETVETLDAGHGRVEWRSLTTSTALNDYLDWPGVGQVFRIERRTRNPKSGQRRQQVVYGITSLSSDDANPERLLNLVRRHWHIENRLHWVRDVTYDEDRSQVRVGKIPQVMAAIRNVAVTLLRANGETNLAAAGRRFAAQPEAALALIGLTP